MRTTFNLMLASLFGFMLVSVACAQNKDLPAEFQQLLPRGRIAAINKPQFVPAKQADISKNSWVLGVVIDGQAKAYSLNLLNSHEVVNDKIGDKNFAAVW